MKTEQNKKLITCILHKAKGRDIVRLLYEEKHINTANVISGRGSGVVEPVRFGDFEVDILTVIVGAERAEEIFNYIYEKAEIGMCFCGFMYQLSLKKSTLYTLPDAPMEGCKS